MTNDRSGKLASQSGVAKEDATLLDSPTGREDHYGLAEAGSLPAGEIARHLPGGKPRSAVTGRHDAGSGANETIDGLTSTEESIRKGAEDVPADREDKLIEDVPVFDRGGRLPRV
jgi:hypothetical protein